jgi:nucleotide-binding universal stress UspA family protein
MKLLIAVDDSEFSRAAVRQVAEMAWPGGTTVLLLATVRSDVFLAADFFVSAVEQIEKLIEQDEEAATERLRALAPQLRAAGLEVVTRVMRGDPRSVIVDAARDEKSDLVVVGSHGRRGLEKLLLGSVASHVVAHAPCSVLVARQRNA